MSIKHTSLALLIVFIVGLQIANGEPSDKPVQHLQLADIDSYEQAKQVFSNATLELQQKDKLDATELHEIHIITYSLEKAVAYFVENMEGEQQIAAKKIAEIVEFVHKGSENNRSSETKTHLKEYFALAETFSSKF